MEFPFGITAGEEGLTAPPCQPGGTMKEVASFAGRHEAPSWEFGISAGN